MNNNDTHTHHRRAASRGVELAEEPLEVTQELLVGPTVDGSSWPSACLVCASPLSPYTRFLLCSARHATCLLCALNAFRSSIEHDLCVCACSPPLLPPQPPCYYLPDALAAVFHAPRLAAAAQSTTEAEVLTATGVEKPLSLRECRLILRGLELEHHKHVGHFSCTPCPGCRAPLLLPSAAVEVGMPAYCHACTHRVCVRCDVLWRESGHEARGGCAGVRAGQALSAAEARAAVQAAVGGLRVTLCPGCGNGVVKEKKGDCNHIKCGCGVQFCYLCGALYSKNFLGDLACTHASGCPQNDTKSVRLISLP